MIEHFARMEEALRRFTSATSLFPCRTPPRRMMDDGYTDMSKLMRALVDVDYRGILIADHVPRMVGDNRTGGAYSIGYIKALYDMARDERGRA